MRTNAHLDPTDRHNLRGAIVRRTTEHKPSLNPGITYQDVLKAARIYVDAKTPLVNQGRNIYGLDCTGLLIVVGVDLGMEITDITGYSRTPPMDMLIKLLRINGLQVVRDHQTLTYADIVRFRNEGRTHVGIIGDKYKPFSVIQVIEEGCIEQRLDPSEIHTVYRHPLWVSNSYR